MVQDNVIHIWRSYLAGVTNRARPGLLSLESKGFRQQTGRRPFPRLGVTTTLMCLHLNKQAVCGPHRRRQSCRFGPLSPSSEGCPHKNDAYFYFCVYLLVRPLSPFLFLFLLRHSDDAPRREQPKFVGEAELTRHERTFVDVELSII